MNKYILFIGIGFELVGLIVGAIYLASFLEEKYGNKGTISAGLILIALVAWFVHIYYLLRKLYSDSK
ncbi:MAG: hypothetical protein KDD45_06430 [Bdellovibrionales bacterium]|nr:hypothetical protein [Bdellovibrionales bacterium]